MRHANLSKILGLILVLAVTFPAFAQDMMSPAVVVDGQVVVDDTVRIDEVVSDGPGFIVIHAADDEGGFGDVIGHTRVTSGVNKNVVVHIDTANATDTVFAMLHEDTGEMGTYEFGTVEDADGPVTVDDQLISPTFNVAILSANDQFVDGSVMIDSVVMAEDGFVVIHAGDEDSFGEVIGFAPVSAGVSTDVMVELTGDPTDVIWPMLHFDTGAEGEYEFGSVEGADGPVVIDGTVATMPIWTVPHIRVPNQIVLHGDGMDMMGNGSVLAKSVLSDGPGFLVIHAAGEAEDGSLAPGEVIGVAEVADGLSRDVVIELDGVPSPILYPMLHVDTGEEGTYEFGTVEGADGPVITDMGVVTFPINASPSIQYDGTLDGNLLTIEQAVIDADGWLVIHADNGEGSFGAVLGASPLREGINFDIEVELDEAMMTDTLYPMLHYDTGEEGTYEFGSVDGVDLPVSVNTNVVVAPMIPTSIE